MLNLLLELFVSLVLCGIFIFFAFLNAPAEAGLTADEEAAAVIGTESAYEAALLPTHELPLFSLLSRCVDLGEDAPCGIAYRWVLMSALHYTAREVYSEARLREWDSGVGDHDEDGQDGGGETESGHLPSRTGQGSQQQPAARGSTPSAGAAATGLSSARRARRRPRRGGPALSAAPPTPLRRESAHWVNVVLRWAAFLCLGGGTVRPEVWTDHLLFHTEKVLNAVNAGYAEKMRARATLVRMLGSQLNGGSGAPQRPLAPQHLLSNAAASHFSVAKPLVRVEQMELGAGLLGGPSRELRRTQPLSTTAGAAGDASALPGSLSPALSAAVSGATVLPSPTLAHAAAPVTAGVLNGGGAAASSAATAGAASSSSPLQTPPPPNNSAIAAAGVMLTSSVVGLGSVLADVVASVTTASHHGVGGAAADSAAIAAGGPGSLAGEYASTSGGGGGTGMSGGAGAQLGIVLPRVEGDVISVEEPFSGAASSGEGGPVPPPAPSSSSPSQHPSSPSVSSTPQPQTLPLRCFAIPLFYNDQRFHLRLGCCLPLGALLPAALCVPPDVLTLDCAVAVRRIIFNGHLHAALHGARVELSFPVAPQFTAAVAVTPDYNSSSGSGGGLRDVHGSGNVTPGYPSAMYGNAYPQQQQQQHYFHSTLSSAGAAAGAARTLGHTFTAINTTRNEATAVRESGGVRGREGSPSVRPPQQQQQQYQPPPPLPSMPSPSGLAFTPRSSAYHTPHYTVANMAAASSTPSSSAATATGTSSINERNEKVQEVVLLAVRRVIESLTYPNVLAGQLVCLPAGATESSGGAAAGTLSMKWQRTTATLPLRM